MIELTQWETLGKRKKNDGYSRFKKTIWKIILRNDWERNIDLIKKKINILLI